MLIHCRADSNIEEKSGRQEKRVQRFEQDIRTTSLEQLIAKFRELRELRAKITGDGAGLHRRPRSVGQVDKASSNVEKSIKL